MKKHLIRIVVSLLILFLYNESVFSFTSQEIISQQYTISDGLPDNNILSIAQDNYGFIWIGTSSGVSRFDGVRQLNYGIYSEKKSLSHHYAQDLLCVPNGNIWIATPAGLNVYRYKEDIIEVAFNDNKNKLSSNDIVAFSEGKNHKIWIATYWDGIDYYDCNTQKIGHIKLPAVKSGKEPNYIYKIFEDGQQNLWIGSIYGLYKYSPQNNTLEHFPMPRVYNIMEDSKHTVWISASNLYYYTSKTNEMKEAKFRNNFEPVTYTCTVEDNKGNLWVGSDQFLAFFSLDKFSSQKSVPLTYIYQQGENFGIPYKNLSVLFFDKAFNLWLGTSTQGVYCLSHRKLKFKTVTRNRYDSNSLTEKSLRSAFFDNEGNIYTCSSGGGVDMLNPDLKKIRNYHFIKGQNSISENTIYCGLCRKNGEIWFGTQRQGISVLNNRTGRFTNLKNDPVDKNTICSNEIRALFETSNQFIFIGTERGLSIYKEGKIDNSFNNISNEIIGATVFSQLNDSVVIIGTYGAGTYFYNFKTKEIITHYYSYEDRKYNVVNDIEVLKNEIWLATYGNGIVILDTKTLREKKELTTKDGLPNNFPKGIVADNKGGIWISFDKNISYYQQNKASLRNFTVKDGVMSNGFSRGGAIFSYGAKQVILFAGNDGFNIFNTDFETHNEDKEDIFFTSLKIQNEEVSPSEKNSPLKENIINTDRLILKYNETPFSLEYASSNIIKFQNEEFLYKLVDVDKNWQKLNDNREITFRNLQPGKYTLIICLATNKDISKKLLIEITPPFWQTKWAYLFYFLIIILIFYAGWHFTLIRIHSENEIKLQKEIRYREEEVHQAKLQFFTNISHELRTPLTLINGPINILLEDNKFLEKRPILEIMQRNSQRLINLVNQLLDFRKAENGQMHLMVSRQLLKDVLRNILDSFQASAKEKMIDLSFSLDDSAQTIYFDKEFFDKILMNLISNALKFTPEGGNIMVEAKTSEKDGMIWLSVSVQDNGCGISQEEQSLIFSRFYQSKHVDNNSKWKGTGIGLHLANQLAQLHHGSISVKSVLKEGSTFLLEIPVDRKAFSSHEMKQEETDDDHLILKNSVDLSEQSHPIVLLVEDEIDMVEYLKQIISSHYQVIHTSNGYEALEILEDNQIDIVVSDINMTPINGIELCKRIKSDIATSHIPLILLTARSSIESKIEGLDAGADSYICKPFDAKHLIAQMANLVQMRQNLKEKYSRSIMDTNTNEDKEWEKTEDGIFIARLIEYIKDNISNDDLNGDLIGAEFGMSRMSLHRKLKSLTGDSINEFIRIVRLKEAAVLLRTTRKTISEIGYDVGFSSPTYFATCFANYFKQSPSDYKKKTP